MNKKLARSLRQKRSKEINKADRQTARNALYESLMREIKLHYPVLEEFEMIKASMVTGDCCLCEELIPTSDFEAGNYGAVVVGKFNPKAFIRSHFYFIHRSHLEITPGVRVENEQEILEKFKRVVLAKEFAKLGYRFSQLAPPPKYAAEQTKGAENVDLNS